MMDCNLECEPNKLFIPKAASLIVFHHGNRYEIKIITHSYFLWNALPFLKTPLYSPGTQEPGCFSGSSGTQTHSCTTQAGHRIVPRSCWLVCPHQAFLICLSLVFSRPRFGERMDVGRIQATGQQLAERVRILGWRMERLQGSSEELKSYSEAFQGSAVVLLSLRCSFRAVDDVCLLLGIPIG